MMGSKSEVSSSLTEQVRMSKIAPAFVADNEAPSTTHLVCRPWLSIALFGPRRPLFWAPPQ